MTMIVDELDFPHLAIMPTFYLILDLIVELNFWSIAADTRQAGQALCKAIRHICIGVSRNLNWPIKWLCDHNMQDMSRVSPRHPGRGKLSNHTKASTKANGKSINQSL